MKKIEIDNLQGKESTACKNTEKRIENSMILHTKKICPEAMKDTPKTENSMSWTHLLKCSQARTTLTT